MIVLLGATGYVGSKFKKYFEKNGIQCNCISRSDFDYSDSKLLCEYLSMAKPEFLVNAAGYTGKPNVDACEIHKTETLFGNAILPGRIAEACSRAKIPWGHVSSGCIFSGDGPNKGLSGFSETDKPNFDFRGGHCSFYSGTKSLGEEILSNFDSVYIWRLRIPFDNVNNPRNYLTKLMSYKRLLEARNSISHLDDFVDACWKTNLMNVPYGIYNITNPGSITTSEVTGLIKEFGICEREFDFFDNEEEFMNSAAKTPRSNCVLNTEKIEACGISIPPVIEALRKTLRSWQK